MVPGVHVKLCFPGSKEGDNDFAAPVEENCLEASVDACFKSGDMESWVIEVVCELPGESLEVGYGARPPEHMAGHCDYFPLLAVVFGLHAYERHDEGLVVSC